MKFNISKSYFTNAINDVSRAVSAKPVIPILVGIKMELREDGLLLTASDTDISIQRFIPVEHGDEAIIRWERLGSVVVPAKFFTDIVRKLPESNVDISVGDHWTTEIRSGKSMFQLNGLDPEEFPRLPQLSEEKVFSLTNSLLRSMIRQTVFAVATTETRPILTGVHWSLEQGRLKMTATDSHRLATREAIVEANEGLSFQNVVIPGESLNELYKLPFHEDEVIDIVVTNSQILFRSTDRLFYTRLLDGTYPDTSRIIPQTAKTEIIVSSRLLADSIDRASLLSKDGKYNIVKLATIEGNTIEISSNTPEVGQLVEFMEASRVEGEELKIAFNPRFVLDAVRAADTSEVSIGFTGSMSPFVIKPVDDPTVLHLILPLRFY